MSQPVILLVDNGSRRAGSTLNLRRLATELGLRTVQAVHPVSLQHADRVAVDQLGGIPAVTFEPFLRRQLQDGLREFVIVPLFFGPSRALTSFIPDTVASLQVEHGEFQVRMADVLCPLPAGEPRLVEILCDHCEQVMREQALEGPRVILVDHGSPIPVVTAVREWLAAGMQKRLGDTVALDQAVMERRSGSEYDFNGRLLEAVLNDLAGREVHRPVVLSMLFLSPGRHAGAGGDIETIRDRVVAAHPGLQAPITRLVGEHPGLVEILAARLQAALSDRR